ncbi:dynein heavy chain [Ectocarpus siliculosus]|uniref:Dynein heavy chain n=1 Tax=Ectocarpus siliculosus TaxID=2880 RepID=D7FS99_ECTSI|nr:dynein heavy chain [Ectocarpus siliculosus]|eukprot:CBJ31040.1 dynein heavy chain [Ectocarpus siliculosus]
MYCNKLPDWFTEWPAEALKGVAMAMMTATDLELGGALEGIVEMFRVVHQSVETVGKEFYEFLRRRVWVTPMSYLELLGSFKRQLTKKREEVGRNRSRLQVGLDKLSSTKEVVATLQEELTVLQPQLVKTMKEVEDMMVQINSDKEEAEVVRVKVEAEEATANEKAAATKAIADDAQRDLDLALPALESAVACLNSLKKADIDEVKSLKTPPKGVKLTMEVCCIMFDVKPNKVKDPDSGKKVDDFWEPAKKQLLADAKGFMDSLVKFDKDNIPDRIIKKVEPFNNNPDFTPEQIEKASKACTAICMWALAMYQYHFVALGVAPKRAALAEAQEGLDIVMAQLKDAKARLAGVQKRLAELQKGFDDAVAKKQELEQKAERCVVQLSNAEKLIGGLGGEEKRWKDTVATLTLAMDKLPGDVVIASGTLSYLGPFTAEYRARIADGWVQALVEKGLDHTEGTDMEGTLADPVKIRQWQMCGLPPDSLSSQNGIIMDTARRWPLLIDPQGQANRFVKNLGKDTTLCPNGMDVAKLTQKKVLQILENGVRFGKWVLLENIGEELDAALEPILLQQKFKQGGQDMIRLGDNTVPYNDQFRLLMITKLPNPEYAPEVQVKVSLLNFTITIKGLEEQLLNTAVKEELPDLAQKKEELVINGAAMNIELYGIESQILKLLSESEGNILDNTALIETLAEAKVKSSEIKEKMGEAEETEKEIEARSNEYRPVAKRASLLYFCLADLAVIDPMYQYALPWFSALFCKSIGQAPPAPDLEGRLRSLNDCFTAAVYVNVCRSLFEAHKLLFSFLLAIKILQGDDRIDPTEWRFLISGMSPGQSSMDNPDPSWIEVNVWGEVKALCGIQYFKEFAAVFAQRTVTWRRVFDSNEPHAATFPAPSHELPRKAGSAIFGVGSYPEKDVEGWLRRMCILRCLRRDKMTEAMQAFVVDVMGPFFVEPPTFDLKGCYEDSSVTMPLIFVLSTGSDPNKDLFQLAEDMGMTDKMRSIALGQGQGGIAAAMIEKGVSEGNWVLLQNCHLSISWMPELERLCEEISPTQTHQDFRLWLTSMPSKFFPTAILQTGVKMTKEPPKGLRANLKATYSKMDDDKLKRTCKPEDFRMMLFGLCFFHALVVERKKFGPLGWNVPYEFNETDLDICIAQLEMYVDEYAVIPYQVLRQLTSVVNYGGRITDDKDMRTSDIIIAGFYNPEILSKDFSFSRSGRYGSIEPDPDNPQQSYLDYIESFPLNAEPEVFGMHENANITCAIADTEMSFSIVLSMQPRTGGGGGASREDLIGGIAKDMEDRLPAAYDVEAVGMAYPTSYGESMNTVLVQELQRYNNLTVVIRATLKEVQKALKGLVVLSAELEAMGNSMFDQAVPAVWQSKGYPSLKPLGPWYQDLLDRLGFMTSWVDNGIPPVFWISGFFFPQGFLTAGQQNFARKHDVPIDSTTFAFHFKDEPRTALSTPEDGLFIHGLFLEGACWDKSMRTLVDPRPKELFSPMPVVHLLPEQDRETPQTGIYRCPVYKILTRTGVLSTTGHSTNFVFWIEIPSNKANTFRASLVSETNKQVQYCDQDYWIKAGAACFCALRY